MKNLLIMGVSYFLAFCMGVGIFHVFAKLFVGSASLLVVGVILASVAVALDWLFHKKGWGY